MQRPILLGAILLAAAVWITSTAQAPTALADNTPNTVNETKDNTTKEATTEPIIEQPHVTTYDVQRGEYLEKIAKAHNISWPSIYELNTSISNPDIIYPNQELNVPDQDVPLTRQLPDGNTMAIPDSYQPKVVVAKKPATATKTAPAPVVASGHLGLGSALSYVGYPYRYGGTSPAGFDCSGFTQFIAAQQGVHLPRTVMAQYSATNRISKGELRPGDLVFFNAHHVGIYIGGGQIIHAATPALGVRIDSLASAIAYNGYMGAGRL